MSILSLSGVSVRYGFLTAVQDVSFEIHKDEIAFLVGPNGAGKSTLLRAIAGALPISEGTVKFNHVIISGLRPEQIVKLGFTLVPEGREIFGRLTVEENLLIGAYLRKDRAEISNDLEYVINEFPALKSRLHDVAGLLSGGQQQMLAIARALMTGSDLIAIDEPALGLAPIIIDQVYDILLSLRSKRGLTLLVAEQSFLRAIEINAKLIMLRRGQIVGLGRARDLDAGLSLERRFFGFERAD